MKEIQATRKVKEAITAHLLRKGGTKDNLPDQLKRVHPSVIEECAAFAKRKRGNV